METLYKNKSAFQFNHKTRSVITEVVISLFILLFVYTATSKLYTFKDFDKVLSEVPLFGSFHTIVAVLIIFSELLIAGLLIVPKTKRSGLYATLGLMIVFTLYLTYMVTLSSKLPCSCGGILSRLSWKNHIWVNLGLVGLASIGISTNLKIKQL